MTTASPHRIVSLLPSATELICELGLGAQLVGVSHECDYPHSVADLPKVTRSYIPPAASSREIDALVRERLRTERALYSLDAERLAELAPDLIVTQTLCNVCAVAEREVHAALPRLPHRPTIVNLEPTSLNDVLDSLDVIAQAAGVPERSAPVRASLAARVAAVTERSQRITDRPKVVFLEWLDPPFCAGHWTPDLIRLAGGDELLGRSGAPSRRLTWEEIARTQPDVLVIGCCGFTIERTRQEAASLWRQPEFLALPAVKSERLYIVDGSAYFNRPGPRLVEGLEVLAQALHPAVHSFSIGSTPAERLRRPL